jgi:peptidoglycan/LPS O-acetylase OafA/YrhL
VSNKSIGYFNHLDGIRFIAAMMVVLNHYLEELKFDFKFSTGFYGVQIFFAISGFLITGILLKLKNAEPLISRRKIVKNFFAKRFLRLFPPYYLLIVTYIILEYFGLYIAEQGWIPFYVAYLPNWFFYYHGWQGTIDNHLWSLGVEEQFYLLWPFVLLMLPKGSEIRWVASMIIIGYLFKCVIRRYFLLGGDPFLLPISQMDTLGIGALLACLMEYNQKTLNSLKKLLPYLIPVAIVLTLITSYDKPRNDPFLCASLILLSGSVVLKAVDGFNGFWKKMMELKWVQYGGKISYGIYLYHKVIPTLISSTCHRLNIESPNRWLVFLGSIGLTFLISHLSWKWLEQPLLKLKSKFEN